MIKCFKVMPLIGSLLFVGFAIGKDHAIESIANNDRGSASESANQLVADYRNLESSLIAKLDSDSSSDQTKVLSIYVLGQIHSRSAISSLITRLDFKAPFTDPALSTPRWGTYPSVDSLIQIGLRTADPILHKLPLETSALRIKLSALVLHDVLGEKVGRLALMDVLDKLTDEHQRANVKDAITEYDRLTAGSSR